MKRLLFLFLLIPILSTAQLPTIPGYTNINQKYQWVGGIFKDGLHVPGISGFPISRTGIWIGDGQLMIDTIGNKLYVFSNGSWRRLVDSSYVAGLVGTGAWSTSGNSGTNPSTNFLGTTDNQPLAVRTNNTERVRVLGGGNVGIGTTTPGKELDVIGEIRASGTVTVGNVISFNGAGTGPGQIDDDGGALMSSHPIEVGMFSGNQTIGIRGDTGYVTGRLSYNGNIHSTFTPRSLVDVSYGDSAWGGQRFGQEDVLGDGNNRSFDANGGSFEISNASQNTFTGEVSQLVGLLPSGNTSELSVHADSILLLPWKGQIHIDSLRKRQESSDSLMTWNPNTGIVSYRAIPSGGSATPAGSNTEIQYNNSGAFGASSNFKYNASSGTMQVINSGSGVAAANFDVGSGTSGINVRVFGNEGFKLFMGRMSSSPIYATIRGEGLPLWLGSDAGDINFETNGATVGRWLTDGNLGIGTTSASEKLHVTGNIRFSGALMPNNSAGTSGQVLTSAGSGSPPTWQTVNTAASQTTTPTLTNGSNVDASTALAVNWSRNGDIVTFGGYIQIDATLATTATVVEVAIPYASNFSNTLDANGTVLEANAPGGGNGYIIANTTNDRIVITVTPVGTSNVSYSFSGTYRIL